MRAIIPCEIIQPEETFEIKRRFKRHRENRESPFCYNGLLDWICGLGPRAIDFKDYTVEEENEWKVLTQEKK